MEDLVILKTDDVMKILRIGREKAYRLLSSKSFPAVKLGRDYFVTKDDLEKWIRQNSGKEYHL